MRFAMRCCNNRAECEDAVQEAFAGLWEHRANVQADKGKSYLMSSAYRQLMQRFRHLKVERRHEQELKGTESVRPNIDFDIKEAIQQSLTTLPELQRAILSLRDEHGYSYREIAETLGQTEDRVQVYLFRARVAMRKQLALMGYSNNQ